MYVCLIFIHSFCVMAVQKLLKSIKILQSCSEIYTGIFLWLAVYDAKKTTTAACVLFTSLPPMKSTK